MDKMFSRLRSMSGGRLAKSPTSSTPPPLPGQPVSKEDIIKTIDGFGDKIPDVAPVAPRTEDNNNINKRRSSEASVNSDFMDLGASDTEPTITSITHSYSVEWEKLFLKPNYVRHLRNYAIKGNLRSSRFRSIAWKLFLEVLPDDSNQWVPRTRQLRSKYKELKDKLIVNPRKAVDTTVDVTINNPLSQEEESPWNRFFLDNELRLTIKQDVIRTYPRIEFFQSNQLRNLMVDILFIYAKLNPEISYRQPAVQYNLACDSFHSMMTHLISVDISPEAVSSSLFPEIEFYRQEEYQEMMANVLFCYSRNHGNLSYRQGMHELLAPMIFVLHCDHQAFLHASEMETLDERIKFVMDPKYLEHDAYAMFSQVMKTMEPWYVSKEVYPTKTSDLGVSQPFARPQDMNPSNVIVTKLTRIQDYLLKKADHELHLHLERHEIAPQIYGIRWIRLLFGREFPMQDLLVLWDAIFADSIGFDLVDYIFVAMLLYLRDHLLSSDYPSCLITLMRYPPVGDIHYFIDKARHLRDPNQYPRPPSYTYQSAQTAERTKPRAHKAATPNKAQAASTNPIQNITRKIYPSSHRPKSLSVSGRTKMSKSSSEPMNLQTDISPVDPTPGDVPHHKRGSTASLSQVEDTMFRTARSSSSIGTHSLRSGPSTPDDASMNGSPTKYATMQNKSRMRIKKTTPVVPEAGPLPDPVALRGLMNDKESMCKYCASKLDHHIESLQGEMLRQKLENEDEILVAIAGIKQVRDVLKGTLKFSQNLLDQDEIQITDNHYGSKMDVSASSTSTDTSPDGEARPDAPPNIRHGDMDKPAEKRKLFYVSSEENSEATDSPSDPLAGSSGAHASINFRLPLAKDFELEDLKIDRTSKQKRTRSSFRSGGPDECESEFSKSWSPDSDRTDGGGMSGGGSDMEESPNPLYRIRHGSYDL